MSVITKITTVRPGWIRPPAQPSFPEHAKDYDELFAAADRALYQVKRQGRDGVAVASSTDEAPCGVPAARPISAKPTLLIDE